MGSLLAKGIGLLGLAFGLGLVLTRIAIRWGHLWQAYDLPGTGKIHTLPIPYTGGLAVTLTTLSIASVWNALNVSTFLFLFTGFLIGWLDDRYTLSPLEKLLFISVPLLAWLYRQGYHGLPLAAVTLLGLYLVNTVNWMDGMDGLLGGLGAITLLGFAILTERLGQPAPALLAFIAAGALLGFLVFNAPPARVFLGDNGSHFLGFLFVVLLFGAARQVWTFAWLLLAVPILNGAVTLGSRLARRAPLWVRARDHTYDHLLRRFSYVRTLWIYYLATGFTVFFVLTCIHEIGK